MKFSVCADSFEILNHDKNNLETAKLLAMINCDCCELFVFYHKVR